MQRVRVPLRVSPLGAHVDHQEGATSGFALDVFVEIAYERRSDASARFTSALYPDESVTIDDVSVAPPSKTEGSWANYVHGALFAVQRAAAKLERGVAAHVSISDPALVGGGVSSSAAVGLAYVYALADVNEIALDAASLIEASRCIEQDYLGLRNGLLDQSIIVLSRAQHLTVLDVARDAHRLVPLSASAPPHAFLLAFSGVTRKLTSTDYNCRVDECRAAAQQLSPSARVLNDVTRAQFVAGCAHLAPALARRATHFFEETARVAAGADAWQRGDLREFGRLMTASGRSSIDLYECGAPPLNDMYRVLVESARGVYGARFSGAGFAGCCVALVDPTTLDVGDIEQRYRARQPQLAPRFIVTHAADGLLARGSDDQ